MEKARRGWAMLKVAREQGNDNATEAVKAVQKSELVKCSIECNVNVESERNKAEDEVSTAQGCRAEAGFCRARVAENRQLASLAPASNERRTSQPATKPAGLCVAGNLVATAQQAMLARHDCRMCGVGESWVRNAQARECLAVPRPWGRPGFGVCDDLPEGRGFWRRERRREGVGDEVQRATSLVRRLEFCDMGERNDDVCARGEGVDEMVDWKKSSPWATRDGMGQFNLVECTGRPQAIWATDHHARLGMLARRRRRVGLYFAGRCRGKTQESRGPSTARKRS